MGQDPELGCPQPCPSSSLHLVRADLAKLRHLKDGEQMLSWPRTLNGQREGHTRSVLAGTSPLPSASSNLKDTFSQPGCSCPTAPSAMAVCDGQNTPQASTGPLCPLTMRLSLLCTTQSSAHALYAGRDALTLALSAIT